MDFNLIVVNDFAYVNGGAEKVAIESAIELNKLKNVNVIFFSAVNPIDERLKNSDVKIICMGQKDILRDKNRFRVAIQGIWNKQAYEEFNILLNQYSNKNTIVHIHSWQKALSSSVIKAATEKRFKIVITLHSYCVACPNGGFYDYKKQKICNVKPLSLKCIFNNCDARHYYHKIWRILRDLTQHVVGRVPSSVLNYIYISQNEKKVLQKYLPKKAKYFYVKNPMNFPKEDRVKVEEKSLLTYIGRLNKEKGVKILAQVSKDLNLDILFIGDGECKKEILEINPKAKITGWLKPKQVKKYLDQTRTLIFPSLLYEGMPLTVLEAKSKGIPVVLSDTCNACEVIENKKEGLWFNVNNFEDIEEKIKFIYDKKNNNKIKDMSKFAYQKFWSNEYSMQNHINMLMDCYKSILEE